MTAEPRRVRTQVERDADGVAWRVSELDPGTRTPEEMADQWKAGPLDRADWPKVGDEVLYHHPQQGWRPATVLDVAEHDGDLCLDHGEGPALAALDAKHGPHRHGWLLYGDKAGPGTSAEVVAPDPDIWVTTESVNALPPRRRWWHRLTRRAL